MLRERHISIFPRETLYGRWGGGGGGTFLSQKSWKFSIVSVFIVYLYAHYQVLALPQVYFYTFIYQTQS